MYLCKKVAVRSMTKLHSFFTVKVDERGRVTIPVDHRAIHNITESQSYVTLRIIDVLDNIDDLPR